jgi:hypothetical protein
MPFSRIALHQGKSAQYLKTLSDSLHQALVETFSVPPADKFQAIDQYRPGELIYDPHYLGGPRSADYVLFYITIGRPRDTATKQRFLSAVGGVAGRKPAVEPAGCDGSDYHHPTGRVVVQCGSRFNDRRLG